MFDLRVSLIIGALMAFHLAAAMEVPGHEPIIIGDSGGTVQGDSGAQHGGGAASASLSLDIRCDIRVNKSSGFLWSVNRTLLTDRSVSYVCIVYHQHKCNVKSTFPSQVHVKNSKGFVEQWLEINGKSFRIDYLIGKEEKASAFDESLSICKAKVDLAHGRVFVIDMTKEEVTVDQLQYDLPMLELQPAVESQMEKVCADLEVALEKKPPKRRRLTLCHCGF